MWKIIPSIPNEELSNDHILSLQMFLVENMIQVIFCWQTFCKGLHQIVYWQTFQQYIRKKMIVEQLTMVLISQDIFQNRSLLLI